MDSLCWLHTVGNTSLLLPAMLSKPIHQECRLRPVANFDVELIPHSDVSQINMQHTAYADGGIYHKARIDES